MATKVILLINGRNPPGGTVPTLGSPGTGHSYAASEGFWIQGGISSATKALLRNQIGPARGACLSSSAEVTAARLYQDGSGRGIVVGIGAPGLLPGVNQANDALLMSTSDDAVNPQRKWWLHFVPDNVFVNGEFNPTFQFLQGLQQYVTQLHNVGYWRAIIRNNLTSIVEITPAGLITFAGANPFSVGQQITITRAFLTDQHRRVGGKFTVATIGPLSTQCTIAGWQYQNATSGQAFIPSYGLRSLSNGQGIQALRSGTRRVGRPTGLYSGRKAKKR